MPCRRPQNNFVDVVKIVEVMFDSLQSTFLLCPLLQLLLQAFQFFVVFRDVLGSASDIGGMT